MSHLWQQKPCHREPVVTATTAGAAASIRVAAASCPAVVEQAAGAELVNM
jgi:hypothetical protein